MATEIQSRPKSTEWWCHKCGFHFVNARPVLGVTCPGDLSTHKNPVEMKPRPPKETT